MTYKLLKGGKLVLDTLMISQVKVCILSINVLKMCGLKIKFGKLLSKLSSAVQMILMLPHLNQIRNFKESPSFISSSKSFRIDYAHVPRLKFKFNFSLLRL